jgi:hypothetical protein
MKKTQKELFINNVQNIITTHIETTKDLITYRKKVLEDLAKAKNTLESLESDYLSTFNKYSSKEVLLNVELKKALKEKRKPYEMAQEEERKLKTLDYNLKLKIDSNNKHTAYKIIDLVVDNCKSDNASDFNTLKKLLEDNFNIGMIVSLSNYIHLCTSWYFEKQRTLLSDNFITFNDSNSDVYVFEDKKGCWNVTDFATASKPQYLLKELESEYIAPSMEELKQYSKSLEELEALQKKQEEEMKALQEKQIEDWKNCNKYNLRLEA